MRLLLLFLLLFTFLQADDLDDLLSTYSHNSDLSKKTKHENGGTVTVYTRNDLEVMQARTLKDLLKSHPVLRYKESRSGIPDMQYRGGTGIFNSSNIRIYVDNQELTSATFGSGFPIANNLNLNTMDHVEIYTRSPSYEFSTEPTYILIKLYSKLAERHRGGSLEASYGNRDFNTQSLFYADELKDFSYVTSLSRRDDRKEEHTSHGIPIKRDAENYTFFGSLYSENQKLQVMAGSSDLDTSIARSPRATYAISDGEYDYLHVGYENAYFEDTFVSLSYQNTNISGHNKEAIGFETIYSPELEYDRHEDIGTLELKHNIETQNNRLILGAKYRYKHFEMEESKLNGVPLPKPSYDEQTVSTVFAEERYSISDHNIINIAGQYAYITNNGGIDDSNLFQFRINHTYIYNDWIFKAFVYRVESLVEPYIYIDFPTSPTLDNQVQHAFSEEIKYELEKNTFRLVFTYYHLDDLFTQTPSGAYINHPETIKNTSAFIEHTYLFDINNKLISNLSHKYVDPFSRNETAAFIRLLNKVGKFDIFNELIYNHNDSNHEHYFDYSAGLRYHYDRSLILSVKGENMFDSAYEDSYFRIDPSTTPSTPETPIQISPVEQRFYMTMEYLF